MIIICSSSSSSCCSSRSSSCCCSCSSRRRRRRSSSSSSSDSSSIVALIVEILGSGRKGETNPEGQINESGRNQHHIVFLIYDLQIITKTMNPCEGASRRPLPE